MMLRVVFRKSSAAQRILIYLLSVALISQPAFAWSGEGMHPRGEESSSADGLAPAASAAEGSGQPLQIDILDGEGALNNIRARTAREPIVQVTDKNHKPVAGALVIFAIQPGGNPAAGSLRHAASASFHGTSTLRVRTDANGRAIGHGLTPNKQAGSFTIQVTAIAGDLTATAIIHEQNVSGPGGNNSTSHSFLRLHSFQFLTTAVGVGAVAATAVAVVLLNKQSSNTITTGTGTVGAP